VGEGVLRVAEMPMKRERYLVGPTPVSESQVRKGRRFCRAIAYRNRRRNLFCLLLAPPPRSPRPLFVLGMRNSSVTGTLNALVMMVWGTARRFVGVGFHIPDAGTWTCYHADRLMHYARSCNRASL
jgi:hypothetical protein